MQSMSPSASDSSETVVHSNQEITPPSNSNHLRDTTLDGRISRTELDSLSRSIIKANGYNSQDL
jgi:hypothetical protein